MYTVWYTSHQINQKVTSSLHKGMMTLSRSKGVQFKHVDEYEYPCNSISYGILRGTARIFQESIAYKKEYWEIDRGYLKPSHFDGYYRISLNNTRAKFKNIELSSDRFDKLGIVMSPWRSCLNGNHVLVVPPTEYVSDFFKLSRDSWIKTTVNTLKKYTDRKIIVRDKDSKVPLHEDLRCHAVVTFNSNVAIDALLSGVPVISTEWNDIKPWNLCKMTDIESQKLVDCDREALLKYLSYCQFTVEEMKSGYAWEKCLEIQKYG